MAASFGRTTWTLRCSSRVRSEATSSFLGLLIAEGQVEALIFFWDPMQAQPHDVDVKALLRIATLYNVPTAIDRSSADFLISSPLFGSDYTPVVKDYKSYVERTLNG